VSGVLEQIVGLIVGAAPTMGIVFLFYLLASRLLFRPLLHTLEQRHARGEGARREAARLEAAAQDRLESYQRAVARIRAEIFAEQEEGRRRALAERAERLQQVRHETGQRVLAAKRQFEAELQALTAELERHSHVLAEQIAAALLQKPAVTARHQEGQP
jgi:F-type H+-transporting ATPase subunit b